MAREPEDDFDIALNRLRTEHSVVGRQIEDLKHKESGIWDSIQALEKVAAQTRQQREAAKKRAEAEAKTTVGKNPSSDDLRLSPARFAT